MRGLYLEQIELISSYQNSTSNWKDTQMSNRLKKEKVWASLIIREITNDNGERWENTAPKAPDLHMASPGLILRPLVT